MQKYRFRLKNSRVIGPFEKNELSSISPEIKSEIKEYQLFPVGDWLEIDNFILSEIGNEPLGDKEATFIRKIQDFKVESKKKELEENFPKEFVINEEDITRPISARDLEKSSNEIQTKSDKAEVDDNLTDTLLRGTGKKADIEADKTLVNLDTKKYLEELRGQKDKEEVVNDIVSDVETEEEAYDLNKDSTQFISIDDLNNDLKDELKNSESELRKELVSYKKKTKKDAEKLIRNDVEVEDEEDEEVGGNKKRSFIIIIALIAIVMIFLTPEEKSNEIKPVQLIEPSVRFPVELDEGADKSLAKDLYNKALVEIYKGSYLSKIRAIKLLQESLMNDFTNNPALARLIYLYSDTLENSQNKTEDLKVILQLIVYNNTKAVLDTNFAAAKALFFLKTEKLSAAINTVEKFAQIKENKPSVELFIVYLNALRKSGDLVKANDIKDKLLKLKSKTHDVFITLFDYLVFEGNYKEASELLASALDQFPESIAVQLRQASLFVYNDDYESLEGLLKDIRKSGLESSRVFYARYLEYKALVYASRQEVELAAQTFSKALELHESQELRARLADLSQSDDQEVNKIIVESKAQRLIAQAKGHLKSLNFKSAFKFALEAKSIAPNYIPARLFLAKLQIEQSYFAQAITDLESLYKEFPDNLEVAFALADAYIEAYKFDKAQGLIASLANSEFAANSDYFSISAKFYVYKDSFSLAVTWLKKAINSNPLDDENIYRLAKLFIRYQKFDQAKKLLLKAIELDPVNIDYRVSYADIIYEQSGAESSIGYLLNILADFPDNPKILGNIAIYYYQSGQQSKFESIHEKLLKLPTKDTALYKFLIQAAKLNEKYSDVIKYSKELININPGDLQARLYLGQVYLELERYKEALTEFNKIKERLDTYPKVQYYISKLYLLTDDIEKAKEFAQKEVKTNKGGIDGYILLGEILMKEKKISEAEEMFNKAARIDRNNVDMLIGLASIYFKKSQYDIAKDMFLRAKNIQPSRAEIHKLLGDVYRNTNQSGLAIESYKLFLELSPNSSYKKDLESYIKMMQ